MNPFSIEAIKHRTSPKIYERGELYFHEDRVINPDLNDNILCGSVIGNDIYQVRIKIKDGDIFSECSCPFEDEEFCKHAVALLLTWEHKQKNESSNNKKDLLLKRLLMNKNKDELADIILQNIEENKRDVILAENVQPSSHDSDMLFISIKSKIDSLFKKKGINSYYYLSELISSISPVIETIEKLVTKGQFSGLELIWHFFKQVKSVFDEVDDSNGTLGFEIKMASEVLLKGLDKVDESVKKTEIIKDIYLEWKKDEYGYFDCLKDVLTHAKLSSREKEALFPLLESEIKKKLEEAESVKERHEKWHSSFQLGQVVETYARLKISSGAVEEGLNCLKKYLPYTKNYDELGRAFLDLNRFEEAEAVTLEGLEKYSGRKERLYELLVNIYEMTKNKDKLKATLLAYFKYRPEQSIYNHLKELKLGEWDSLQKNLQSYIDQPRYFHILISIYADENRLLDAFHLAEKYKAGADLLNRLAKKLEKEYPNEAISCYKKVAEYHISKGSKYYNFAVNVIDKIYRLYLHSGKKNEGNDYIAYLKEIYKRKSSFIKKMEDAFPLSKT